MTCAHRHLDACGIIDGRSAVRCLDCGAQFHYDSESRLLPVPQLGGGALADAVTSEPLS